MKKVNPVDRAFDYWLALSEPQKAELDALKRGYFRAKGTAPAPEKRGRPVGSKNQRALSQTHPLTEGEV